MKTTFLNQLVRGAIPSIYPRGEILDGLGKFQSLDRVFVDMNNLYNTISDRVARNMERQQKESDFLQELLNQEMLNGLLNNWPTTANGLVDTISLWLGVSPKLEWEQVNVYLIDENLQVLPEKVDYSIVQEKILVNAKSAPYTLIHYKLPTSANTSGFIINCNPSTLISVSVKDPITNAWEESPTTSDLLQKQDKSFYDVSFSELKVVVKNVTISNNYAVYFSAEAMDGSKRNISLPINWSKGLAANNISLNLFARQGPVFLEGSLTLDGKSYNVQMPSWMSPTSRLDVIKYTSLTLNTYTICRCPYPVDLTSEISVFKSLNDYQSSTIVDWEGSVDGINWVTPNNVNTLSYLGGYSDKPKYFYVRLKGFFESAFIYYKFNKTIDCSWPLSNDERLFFNGSGIGIKNLSFSPVQLFGSILFSESNSYNESMPFGSIGID